MASYIFHNETRSEVADKRLLICPEDVMNSYLVSGAYFRAIIKDNNWDKKDIICAMSDDEVPILVYEDDVVVLCDDISHIERLENTLDQVEQYNLEKDELIVIKCEDEKVIWDCGCPSEVDEDFFDNETEIESVYSDIESVYSDISDDDDIEDEIWALRRKMVGLKNITKERIKEVRDGYFKLSGKGTNNHLRIELGMDLIKYLWKMVIMEFTNMEHFRELCDEIFEFIEKRLKYVESYMRVEYENFREDIVRVSSMEIKN